MKKVSELFSMGSGLLLFVLLAGNGNCEYTATALRSMWDGGDYDANVMRPRCGRRWGLNYCANEVRPRSGCGVGFKLLD